MEKKLVVLNLSGYGINVNNKGNLVNLAYKPTLDYLFSTYPIKYLDASSKLVGLSLNQPSNSSYGHLCLGLGYKPYLIESYISNQIETGQFYNNDTLSKNLKYARDNFKQVHVICLLSQLGKICNFNHIVSLIKAAKLYGIFKNQLHLHVIFDGIDSSKNSALVLYKALNDILINENVGHIDTVCGRNYALDNSKDFSKPLLAYNNIAFGKGNPYFSIEDYLSSQKKNLILECDIQPGYNPETFKKIEEGDLVISLIYEASFINELNICFTNKQFVTDFINQDYQFVDNIYYVSLVELTYPCKGEYCYPHLKYQKGIGEIISENNLSQIRISDSLSKDYLTYYFDGMKYVNLPNSKFLEVKLNNLDNFSKYPNLNDNEIVRLTCQAIKNNEANFIFTSFSSLDVFGHFCPPNFQIKNLEHLDSLIKLVYDECLKNDYTLLITSDHSKIDRELDANSNLYINHTLSKVPFCLVGKSSMIKNRKTIIDIAPSILDILGISKPSYMEGNSLLEEER